MKQRRVISQTVDNRLFRGTGFLYMGYLSISNQMWHQPVEEVNITLNHLRGTALLPYQQANSSELKPFFHSYL